MKIKATYKTNDNFQTLYQFSAARNEWLKETSNEQQQQQKDTEKEINMNSNP